MITLLIVLVLLFVIFRLMPGDPTRFFIRPGLTRADEDALKVAFGFAKYVPAPGHGFEAQFETPAVGVYEITITVNDTKGRSQPFHYHYAKNEAPVVVLVQVNATNGDPPYAIGPGDGVTVLASLVDPDPADRFDASVVIERGGVEELNASAVEENAEGTRVSYTSWAPSSLGAYSVRVTFREETTQENITGYAGVAANTNDTSPFHLVEEMLFSEPTSELLNRAGVTINVTSSGASVSRVTASVRSPGGSAEQLSMTHPLIAVDNNVLEEFWAYMTNMLRLDFGRSLYSRRLVVDEIAQRIRPTILLFGSAVITSYTLGILVGTVLAWRRGSKLELSAIVFSLFFYSMPVFWFGLILLWFFAFSLGWFPLGGFADPDAQGIDFVFSVLRHMALPLLNLVILSLAGTTLLMRNSMLEVMGEDYITTAKAKGISERRIMYRHAARNAMLPVVTSFAMSLSGIVSGGVLTETIFSWPGMGAFLITATLQQDFPSVQGAFFLLAIITISANFVADILYAYLDPRVRL